MTRTSRTHRSVCLAIAAVALTLAARTTVHAQQSATYEIVSSFTLSFPGGKAPTSIAQANDGSFYGTTSSGGTFDAGVLFRMDGTGTVAVLHHFAGGADGGQPYGLVRASDGRIYGATQSGTLFTVTPGGSFATLYTFSSTDSPVVDLFAASDGNVYGVLGRGGDFGRGSIFMVDPAGNVATIHHIPLSVGSAANSVVKGRDGRLYLTSVSGGAFSGGSVFAIDDAGTITTLYSFSGASDGAFPSGLTQGSDGRLYGTTRSFSSSRPATVYAVDVAGDYERLHTFDSSRQQDVLGSDLVEASDGNFYGEMVGSSSDRWFRLGSNGTFTTPVFGLSFPGQMIQGTDGRLYDTTTSGGVDGAGSLFAVDLAGTVTTLYEFSIGAGVGGAGRPNGVIQASDGTFYGTTYITGSRRIGTVFSMNTAGTRTTVHAFLGFRGLDSPDDGTPRANLFEGADGSLYGTTYTYGDLIVRPGQVFRISAGVLTRLASLNALQSGVIQARDGRLYGVTADQEWPGQVFRVEANGTVTTLHWFGTESAYPAGELVEIDDGSLYGATAGGGVFNVRGQTIARPPATIFRVDPTTGAFADRYRFPEGVRPAGRLIQGTDGLLYGVTVNGGSFGLGTVFSLDAADTLTTLHEFNGAEGANPTAGVIQGRDGRLYGVTNAGGASGYGTVFVMNVTGGLTTLHHFALSDGGNPVNELIQAADGAFYGAAPMGGPLGGGVVFRLRVGTTPPADGYVEIVSRHSGKCLDLAGGSTEPGAPVVQWTCHGGPNQQWRLEPAGGGAVRLISRYTGQALDVAGGSIDDGAAVVQWPVHGGDNQAWTLEPATDGYVRLVVRHSGKAMDVEFGSTGDGARVLQWSPHGGANQQWLLRPSD